MENDSLYSTQYLQSLSKEELIDMVVKLSDSKQEYENQKEKILLEVQKAAQHFVGDMASININTNSSLVRGISYALGLIKKYIDIRFNELAVQNEALLYDFDEKVAETIIKEANLSSLINNTYDFICSINTKFDIQTINKSYQDFLKTAYNVQAEVGSNFKHLFPQETFNYWLPFYKKVFKGETFKYIHKKIIGDTTLMFEVSFNPIYQPNQEKVVVGASIFVRDITKQSHAEEKIKEQNKQLKEINADLDEFVYSVSHDLKAPLASIMGLLNLIQLEGNFDNIKQYLMLIEKSVYKLDAFILELIQYTRNKQMPIKVENVFLRDNIQEIIEGLIYVEENKAVNITINVEQDIPLYTDNIRLNIILSNIIANAFRYANFEQPEPYIKIRAKVTPKKVFIQVEDNGIGIAQEHLRKVFKMFYRATQKITGSGLGLYIVKETIKKLKAKIKIKSELGKGTTLFLEIPQMLNKT